MKKRLLPVLVSLLAAILSSAALAADIWYEDNNLGRAGGVPPDFVEKFRHPEQFSQATKYIRVYMMRSMTLAKLGDDVLTGTVIPFFKKNRIKLAINAVGATWTKRRGRSRLFEQEMSLLKRLKARGFDVDYISLQSVLSKPAARGGDREAYSLRDRVDDVVAYARAARAVFPRVQIGIIDALPSHGKDYRLPYRRLQEALARESIELSYIHLDMPFELPRERRHGITWRTIREVERYVEEDLHTRFGLITTSRKGGKTSSRLFHERVLAALTCYAGAEGTPGDLVIASWYPYPDTTVPDTATGNDFPAMRTVLEFGRELDRIEAAGPSWAAGQAGRPEWNALCTAP